ncbi:MAG: hypothetical protein SF029_04920 [bacterium]|nr:hypothetical protein [bacterium]
MYARERLIATIFIWFAVGSIGTMFVINAFMMSEAAVITIGVMTLVIALAALLATRFVWNGTLGMTPQMMQQQAAEKGKRSSDTRVSRMLAGLTEDELDDLRERLMAQDDGEMTSLEALMMEQNRRSRR